MKSWNPEETSRRLELVVGRDLQFVRINGTLVGGLVGLLLYAVSRFAGYGGHYGPGTWKARSARCPGRVIPSGARDRQAHELSLEGALGSRRAP